MVPPSTLLRALENAGAHTDRRTWLTLDRGYVKRFDDSESVNRLREMFGARFMYIETDPIDRGIIRVTHDGLVLSPFESINTADYGKHGRPLRRRSLGDWYQSILAETSPVERQLALSAPCH